MGRTCTADVFTLRPRREDLLPRITLLLYVPSKQGLLATLHQLAKQADPNWEIWLMLDGVYLQDEDLKGLLWPDDISLQAMETEHPYGKSYCVNLALTVAESEYLFVAEAGDILNIPCLTLMAERLGIADRQVIGLIGDLEWSQKQADGHTQSRYLPGIQSERLEALFSHLSRQKPLAPPLVRTDAAKKIGGYPTDYPGEGFRLADTAFLLALLQAGQIDTYPSSCLSRTVSAPDVSEVEDDRKLLQVLLRQAVKQLHLPLHWARLT